MAIPTKPIFDQVISAIDKRGLMIRLISERTSLCKPTVTKVINCLHENGVVYIARWERVRQGKSVRSVPCYRFGSGVDIEKPPTQTHEQRMEAKRICRAQTKSRAIDADYRARIAEELARPAFRDPFIAQFFGPYEARP